MADALRIPRFGAPGSLLRAGAGVVLTASTLALVAWGLRGGAADGGPGEALLELAPWLLFALLYWLAVRRSPEDPWLPLGPPGILLRPRLARRRTAGALLALPVVALVALSGRLGGIGPGLVAVALALSWFALLHELRRSLWLTERGVLAISPWTGKVQGVLWEEMLAVVEERRWTGATLAVVGPEWVIRLLERGEGAGDFAAMCLQKLAPESLAQPGLLARLEALALDRQRYVPVATA